MKRGLMFVVCLAVILPVTALGMKVSDEPEEKEKVPKGWLGVSIQDVTPKIAKRENLRSEDGAYIADVEDDSPAKDGGLQRGDVIVEFNDRAIYDSDDLAKSVKRVAPGTKANILVIRNGEKKAFQVTIGKAPREESFVFRVPRVRPSALRMFHGQRTLGLTLLELNKQLGGYFGAPEGEGVLVEEVDAKSAGEKAGFNAGDVILKIGKRSINDVEDVWRALESYSEEGKTDVQILRKGSQRTLKVEIPGGENEKDDAFWYEFGNHGSGDLQYSIPKFDLNIPNLDFRIQKDVFRRLEEALKFRRPLDTMKFSRTI